LPLAYLALACAEVNEVNQACRWNLMQCVKQSVVLVLEKALLCIPEPIAIVNAVMPACFH